MDAVGIRYPVVELDGVLHVHQGKRVTLIPSSNRRRQHTHVERLARTLGRTRAGRRSHTVIVPVQTGCCGQFSSAAPPTLMVFRPRSRDAANSTSRSYVSISSA